MGLANGVRGGSIEAEEPGKAEVAPAASLDGTRRSEKAEVLEKAQREVQRRDPRTSQHTVTYKDVHIMHTTTRFWLAYPLRCRGY
jgi:hypothetical protein